MMRTLVIGLLGLLLAGCTGTHSSIDATRPYPAVMVHEQSMPIQVIRRTNHIELTNTTARSYGPSTVWLNRRFAHEIDGFGVGQTLRLDLRLFYDEWGDRFRAGGFFATRDPDALVLVEIEHEGVITGLVMVGNLYE